MDKALALLIALGAFGLLGSVLAVWLGRPLARWLKKKLNDDQEAAVDATIQQAYWLIEKMKRLRPGGLEDAAGEFLKEFLRGFQEEFGKEAPPNMVQRAKRTADAMHELRRQGGGSLQLKGAGMINLPPRFGVGGPDGSPTAL